MTPLVLSSPAGPNQHKIGVDHYFYITISSRFLIQMSYVKSSHQCSNLGFALNLSGPSKMGSLLIIVVKL